MKRLIISLIAGVVGIAALLAGLAWDAWLHAQDATLAQREGIFTLTNPGHALLGIGMALACGGVFSALHAAWGMTESRGAFGSTRLRNGALGGAALASVAAVAFALSASAAGHEHHDGALASADHAHGADVPETHAHTEDSDAVMSLPVDGVTEVSKMTAFDAAPAAHAHPDAMAAAAPHTHEEMAPAPDSASLAVAPADRAAPHAHPAAAPVAPAADEAMPAVTNDAHEHPVASTEEQACYAALTEEARVATTRFQDYAVAEAEGYRTNPLKPEATHYGNPAYRRDGAVLDLARPETLVYKTLDDGSRLLMGVLYTSPKGTPGPTPCGAATFWHTHTACVDPQSRAQIEDAEGVCPEGSRLQESGEMMHLWFVGRKSPL